MSKQSEDPLIQVNWSKFKHYLIQGLGLARKLGEGVLKTIFKGLNLLLLGFIAVYKGVSNFAKSKQRGFWILFFIAIIIWLLFYFNKHLVKGQKEYQELKQQNEQQIQELNNKNQELEKKLEEIDKKIQVYNARKIRPVVYVPRELSPEIKGLVAKYADTYGVSRPLCECIVSKESGGNPNAVGDDGAAIGVAQYHLGTFLGHRRQMGLSVVDLRRDPDASIQAMAWSISNGGGGNWTTYRSCI